LLEGRRVVLGVSGGIAAYKAIEVCRRLVDAGAFVSPVLTPDSLHFVTAQTFSALASEPARVTLWDSPEPSPHTHLGQHADLVVVAPATSRVLAAYAMGLSDDLLVATLLATRAPVLVCPAMHTEMWEQPAVQANIALLRSRGVTVLDPVAGHLAGGDVGMGRLPEPVDIVAACDRVLDRAKPGAGRASASEPDGDGRERSERGAAPGSMGAAPGSTGDFAGLTVLVTAGGTREPIDPVRFVGNRSSGKQGHALAEEAAARGAQVTLVTTVDRSVSPGIDVVRVETAAQMEAAVQPRAEVADVIVMAAAVADFRPKVVADGKLKKADGVPELVLEPTSDILAGLGARKRPGQTLVGFAAETSDILYSAAEKVGRKRLDLIVANDVSAPGVGFEHDTNAVVLLGDDGSRKDVPLADKRAVARAVLDAVLELRSRP
jgi:phosphopantothenoylcysteine decarboxylase/phosphopantothenate--cysteine ligase